MLARPLTWAAAHGFTDRVRLLLRHGVDPDARSPEGRALPLAAAAGHREIVELLLAAGAEPAELSPVAGLVAAVLAGDEAGRRPWPCCGRAGCRPGLVAEAVEAGADTRARGPARLRRVRQHEGQTALHTAAWNGDLDLVRRLVSLGADLDARDGRFDGRPVDWAGHAQHPDVVSFLAGRGAGARRTRARVAAGGNGTVIPTPWTSQRNAPSPGPVGQLGASPPGPAPRTYPSGSVGPGCTGGRRGSTPRVSSACRWSSRRVSPARRHGRRRRPSPARRAR
jgi:hypothetical protein